MTKGSDLLVAALENEGVEYIFGVPGEENLDVVESLRNSRIELVLTRHEQSAAFMAATHGRLTGRPGVCIATLGPGALNLVTGAAYAHLGAMPMILITGTFRIRPGSLAAVKPAMARMIAASRAEPGCLAYSYAQDVLDEGLIRVTELWTDQAALDRHFASAHIAEWRSQWAQLGLTDRKLQAAEVGEAHTV